MLCKRSLKSILWSRALVFFSLMCCVLIFQSADAASCDRNIAWDDSTATEPIGLVTVVAPDGVSISATHYGNEEGKPIVFVHGMSQAGASWMRQVNSSLADKYHIITFDLRGHGFSGKPTELSAYISPGVWGNDLNAVITAFGLENPVLVGWSFGTQVIREYLYNYGDSTISGVAFVGGPASIADFGPGSAVATDMMSADYSVNLAATMQFVRNCSFRPLPRNIFASLVGINMSAAVIARMGAALATAPAVEELANTTVPFMLFHGQEDQIILPSGSYALAGIIPNATVRIYPSAGHLVFMEKALRFNADLETFIDSLE